jgi:hypothetical protein
MGINWLGEFAPEIVRVLRKKKVGAQANLIGFATEVRKP